MYDNFFYVPTITSEKEGKRAFRVDIFEMTKPEEIQWIGLASVILGANDEVLYYTLISKYEKTNPQGSSIYDKSQFVKEGSTFPEGLYDEKKTIIKVCKEYSEFWGCKKSPNEKWDLS